MWRITNFLFGWDYVGFDFGGSFTIRRVRTDANGKKYAVAYDTYIDIINERQVVPLTKGAAKYLQGKNEG